MNNPIVKSLNKDCRCVAHTLVQAISDSRILLEAMKPLPSRSPLTLGNWHAVFNLELTLSNSDLCSEHEWLRTMVSLVEAIFSIARR